MTRRRPRPPSSAWRKTWRRAQAPEVRLPLLLALADGASGVDARRALGYAQEADAIAQAQGDARARAEARYLAGRCAELLLDHGVALAAYGDALEAFEAAQDDCAIARTLRAISFVHDTLGDFSRALDYQLRALEIDRRTGDEGSRAATLRTIGIVYSRSGDPDAGLDYYRQSLALCRLPQDALERGKTLNNIGINLKNLGRYEEARAALDEAHDQFAELGLPLQQSAALNNLGLVMQRLGDAAGAERTLRDALELVGGDRLPPGCRARQPGARQAVPGAGPHDDARGRLRRGAGRSASGTG